jgi:bifunctional enzyme CysN/CysC
MPILDFLAADERKDLLRFTTCGSVDDGKSTLIGRLLYDSKGVYEDQLTAAKKATKADVDGEVFDYSLLTDGLKAEREQGITIDVAYRYFSTPKRKFIIADTPGHEQYTRNMATGASTANLAIVLIDARHGVLVQSRRHAFISSLLGIPHIVVAVNKMDLVGYDQAVYEAIKREFAEFAAKLQFPDLHFIPVSALKGDNVVERSANMPWFNGEPLLSYLENVYITSDRNLIDLRLPIQCVIRPNQDFRGFAGQIASGVIRAGDEVLVLPAMKKTRVKAIVAGGETRPYAFPPQSVAVTLAEEIDISRGDMIVHPHNVPEISRHFEAMVVWMDETPLDPNTQYLIKHTSRTAKASVDSVRFAVDVNTLHRAPAETLRLNEIGRLVLTSSQPLYFDAYRKNRSTGCFILIDPMTHHTVAAGMLLDREVSDRLPSRIAFPRHEDSSRPRLVTPEERLQRYGHQPATVWLTGLTACGKIELAQRLEKALFERGAICALLTGSDVRAGLSRELDFAAADRAEHLRRVAETARLLNANGIIAICAFLSPSVDLRAQVAQIVGPEKFLEVHVDAPLAWCEAHDATGIYQAAREGRITHLAGFDVPYEPPATPALHLPIDQFGVDQAVERLLAMLADKDVMSPKMHE